MSVKNIITAIVTYVVYVTKESMKTHSHGSKK